MRSPVPEYAVDLFALDKPVRDMLPMSIRPNGQVLSRYGDEVWDFWPYINPNNTKSSQNQITFGYTLPDGQSLTDPAHSELLESARAYLYVRLRHKHPRSGLTLSHSSLRDAWTKLRILLKWMVGNGYRRFSDLTPTACMLYVEEIRDRKLAATTMTLYLLVVEDLHIFRDHLEDALPGHPWPRVSAGFLAGLKSGTRDKQGMTDKIPDRLTKKLAQGILRYVESGYGEQLLACRDAYEALELKDTTAKKKAIRRHLRKLKLKNWKAVKEEIGRLYTSCYVVTALFSGVRDSEMGSLRLRCYSEHEGWDGARYGWITGLSYKMEKNPKPAEWMVPPVVKKAVELAARVSAPLRAELEMRTAQLATKLELNYANKDARSKDEDALHKLIHCRDLLFLAQPTGNSVVAPWHNDLTNKRLKKLADHIDLRVEPDDIGQVMVSGKNMRVGHIWPLAPHQFRKTFAVYAARNTFGDVLYLRHHFRHVSLDMTLFYAAADLDHIDETLFEDVLQERDELQAIIVEGWLNVDKPVTGAGSVRIRDFRKRDEVRVAKDHRDLARKLSQGFFIRGTGHSWCTADRCKGLGIYDVTECADCDNRLIDETHLMVWRGIRGQQIELLQMDDLGDPMWERAKNHLRYAEEILQELGEEVEAYPVLPMPSERRNSLRMGHAN
jgi:integrase